MYCRMCGAQNDENNHKCVKCGEILHQVERVESSSKKKSGLFWLGGCLGLLGAVPVFIVIVGILAAIAVPLMSANKEKAISYEAIACFGMMDTACRLYRVEHASWPMDVDDLLDAEFLSITDLDGTYFTSNDYRAITLGAHGDRGYGVVSATVGDYALVWDDADRRYRMTRRAITIADP